MNTTERIDAGNRAEAGRTLEHLLTVCTDGVEGYRRAAAIVTDRELHALLQQNAVEREEVASVLTNVLVDLGARHEHHGSLAGALHRGWLSALAATHADDAIIHECVRGDQRTLAAFADALAHELPADIRARVDAQVGRVLQAMGRLSIG